MSRRELGMTYNDDDDDKDDKYDDVLTIVHHNPRPDPRHHAITKTTQEKKKYQLIGFITAVKSNKETIPVCSTCGHLML